MADVQELMDIQADPENVIYDMGVPDFHTILNTVSIVLLGPSQITHRTYGRIFVRVYDAEHLPAIYSHNIFPSDSFRAAPAAQRRFCFNGRVLSMLRHGPMQLELIMCQNPDWLEFIIGPSVIAA